MQYLQIFDKCKQLFVADWCDEKQLLKTISSVFKQTGNIHPHQVVTKKSGLQLIFSVCVNYHFGRSICIVFT